MFSQGGAAVDTIKDAGVYLGIYIEASRIVVLRFSDNIEGSDEFGLFRLTDDGLSVYIEEYENAASIMAILINNKRAVVEVVRYKTIDEAKNARAMLPEDERARTLIRPVRPDDLSYLSTAQFKQILNERPEV